MVIGTAHSLRMLFAALLVFVAGTGHGETVPRSFLAMPDKSFFEDAIAAERMDDPPGGVTGITVPHHLLAADLIARGFWAAAGGEYDRVILLSPDHYRLVEGAFATSATGMGTPFGHLRGDVEAARTLLAKPDFEQHPDLAVEHGLAGVTPFIKAFFPEAQLLPVVASIYATEADWKAVADMLSQLVDDRTLIVQSTDFSHYLSLPAAIQRDQEVLSIIATGNPAHVSDLIQPDHMDSKAAQFIQTDLQSRLGSHAVVVANRNSVEYGTDPRSTTSYVTTVFLQDPAEGARLRYDDQAVYMFGGDTLLGRFFQPALDDPGKTAELVSNVRALTAGAPLILNLEGVILDDVPIGMTGDPHLMLRDIAIRVLQSLDVAGAGLANNHSLDFGLAGLDATKTALETAGILPLENRVIHDFGDFRLLPINFIGDRLGEQAVISDPRELDFVCRTEAQPPLVAFLHWGPEYTSEPREFENAAARQLATCGVTLIIGAHSHQRSNVGEIVSGGEGLMVFSLGNFLFDQRGPKKSGALLEVRAFRQGTIASRLIGIPNFFEEALQ